RRSSTVSPPGRSRSTWALPTSSTGWTRLASSTCGVSAGTTSCASTSSSSRPPRSSATGKRVASTSGASASGPSPSRRSRISSSASLPRTRVSPYDASLVSPVPWCPPLPQVGPLVQYARFRRVLRHEVRGGVVVERPRFLVGPGSSTYMAEARSMARAVESAVERMHAERPFDLIHAHFVYPEGVVAHRLARKLGVPFLITAHAPWTGWLDRPGVARQAIPAAKAAALLMPVSTSVERTIRAYAGVGPRTRVVPVPVDGELFRPTGSPRDPDRVLFVGFVNYVKGIDSLLRAMRHLVDRGSSARLVLVGGAHYRNTLRQQRELERLATDLALDGRVTFAGRKPPAEVARLMAESALVVLPSRAESFGAVLVE